MSLEGRGAVVTGGGRGIGEEVARVLASAGARVVVSARTQSQIGQVAQQLCDEGYEAWAIACDVTDPDEVRALMVEARTHLGPVQILVNNAGVASSAPLKRTTLEEWNRLLAVNATGPFLCTREVLPDMLAAGWGRVVNVASIAGKVGAPYIAAYCASKHAVVGFTRAVASEVGDKGVTVNAVCPGYVDTPMLQSFLGRDHDMASVADEMRRVHPLRRYGTPEDVANLANWLAGDEARYASGQLWVLDGGLTAQVQQMRL